MKTTVATKERQLDATLSVQNKNTLKIILTVFFLLLFSGCQMLKHALNKQKKTRTPANTLANQNFEDCNSHLPRTTRSNNR